MTIEKDKSRRVNWPIRLRWSSNHKGWFTTHGWQIGSERVPVEQTSFGCMPGYRAVFGWTFHLGPLKVCFGRKLELGCQLVGCGDMTN